MGGVCGTQGVMEKYVVGLVQEAEGKEASGRPRHRWKNDINLLKTKRNLLYVRNQPVPRSKHFPPRL
jgi:hypothetical protein